MDIFGQSYSSDLLDDPVQDSDKTEDKEKNLHMLMKMELRKKEMEKQKIIFNENILPKIEEKIMGIAQNLRWTLLISEGGSTDDVIE